MKHLLYATSLVLAGLLVAGSIAGTQALSAEPTPANDAGFVPIATEHESMPHETMPHETMLLVSLADGSVIMQKIQTDAAICFKQNSDSLTTCLTEGEPVIDPVSNSVIGFEMIEQQIELVARHH